LKKDFLLEIGSENLPSGYIDSALEQLRESFVNLLDSARVGFDSVRVYGTPRRLVVHGIGLAVIQDSSEEKVIGPPLGIAMDESGNFTKAAVGFARSQGVDVSELRKVETDRGLYLAVVKKVKGRRTTAVLRESLPGIISGIRFPKIMRWDDSGFRWPRPVRWILCLFGDDVVRIRIGNITSGCITHLSVYEESPVSVKNAVDYFWVMAKARIVLSNSERRELVRAKAAEAAERCGGRLVEDEDLVCTVANMLEVPVPIFGSYDRTFLKLPDEVIVTALKSHQKYFSIKKKRGNSLIPYFVAFADGARRNLEGIKMGYERVLHARLDDAVFYFNEDTAKPLDSMAEKLAGIVWMEGLGSLAQKASRMEKLALWVMDEWMGMDDALAGKVRRASRLAKADLASEMVKDGKEFTRLQGYIGREYARISGEDGEIAGAIFEHYLPRFAGDKLPQETTGILLAVADKVDTIAGCFALELEPTGSQDPYALRRHAAGLLRILIEKEIPISIRELFDEAIKHVLSDASAGKVKRDRGKLFSLIKAFLDQRLSLMLRSSGFDYDLVNAAIFAPWDSPIAVRNLVQELQLRRRNNTLEPLVLAIKRIANILPREYREDFSKGEGEAVVKAFAEKDEAKLGFSSSLFKEEAEKELYKAVSQTAAKLLDIYSDYSRFHEAVVVFEGLRDIVNRYFDDVLVNCEDTEIRRNRLLFLLRLNQAISLFCDFSKISGE